MMLTALVVSSWYNSSSALYAGFAALTQSPGKLINDQVPPNENIRHDSTKPMNSPNDRAVVYSTLVNHIQFSSRAQTYQRDLD